MSLNKLARMLTTGAAAIKSWRLLLAILLVAVTWLALTPAPPEALSAGWDKLNHAAAFAALCVAALFAFPRSRSNAVWVALALLCFGGAIEVAQSFTPTRNAEWGDLLADAVGIAVGGLLVIGVARLLPAR
jgi:VanZ family protein